MSYHFLASEIGHTYENANGAMNKDDEYAQPAYHWKEERLCLKTMCIILIQMCLSILSRIRIKLVCVFSEAPVNNKVFFRKIETSKILSCAFLSNDFLIISRDVVAIKISHTTCFRANPQKYKIITGFLLNLIKFYQKFYYFGML